MVMQDISAACGQLLSQEDLIISDEMLTILEKRVCAIEIMAKPHPIIRIYSHRKLTLTEIIPAIHNFKFHVLDELSYEIPINNKPVYVNRFNLDIDDATQLMKTQSNIVEILSSYIEGDLSFISHLFELVYKENFCLRGVKLFRALINYTDQLILAFNNAKIVQTIVKHSTISAMFLDYFIIRFDPEVKNRDTKLKKAEEALFEEIKKVQDITEDRILKIVFSVLKSILRTSYFLKKETIAFKIDLTSLKPYLNGIQPNLEMFVYHQDFNGIHLRMGKISRGGLRWSERHEDFRQEVKSLMAAQEGKNAVIIPQGAKGGLVIFKDKEAITKEAFESYYKAFINGMLDLVDNVVDDTVVPNADLIKYDDEDAYFVVAADKGTAQMSDTANAIALERNYWLGDAFASGGSRGYHHKKLGITAKGSIRSTSRFFIERGINFFKEPITVVGIGSMNGDVFGNGMLESEHFKLIAAISHKEIFIDPNPDPKVAFEERKRLFESEDGRWSHYDTAKISQGGGVFKRSEKEITLSPEIKKLLGTQKKTLNAEELAKKLLSLPVDMLYNGGVGTYVKASSESNLEVGDKENEALRINAPEIQAYCVCEGGNLGLTQKARIEYALNGGRINQDSVDNSAGVDTSDHEVNMKILLDSLIHKGILKEDKRDESLLSLSDHVTKNVLLTNYLQSLSLSIDELRSRKDMIVFKKVIEVLETHLDYFHRHDFDIPKNVNLTSVMTEEGALIRPILATLMLYSKLFLKNLLRNSDLLDDDHYFDHYLFKYFPKPFIAIYEDDIKRHPLRKEIIAMIIANGIINFAGSTFIHDYEALGKENFLLKIKAYLISNELFSANDIRFEIYRSDYEMDVNQQYQLLMEVEQAIEYNNAWMLKRLRPADISFTTILEHKSAIEKILSELQTERECLDGACSKINHFFATLDYLKLATAIIHIKKSVDVNFNEIATLFYYIMDKLEITFLLDTLATASPKSEVEIALKGQLQKIIELMIIDATRKILAFKRKEEGPKEVVESYLNEKGMDYEHYHKMIADIEHAEEVSITELSVAINYLLLL